MNVKDSINSVVVLQIPKDSIEQEEGSKECKSSVGPGVAGELKEPFSVQRSELPMRAAEESGIFPVKLPSDRMGPEVEQPSYHSIVFDAISLESKVEFQEDSAFDEKMVPASGMSDGLEEPSSVPELIGLAQKVTRFIPSDYSPSGLGLDSKSPPAVAVSATVSDAVYSEISIIERRPDMNSLDVDLESTPNSISSLSSKYLLDKSGLVEESVGVEVVETGNLRVLDCPPVNVSAQIPEAMAEEDVDIDPLGFALWMLITEKDARLHLNSLAPDQRYMFYAFIDNCCSFWLCGVDTILVLLTWTEVMPKSLWAAPLVRGQKDESETPMHMDGAICRIGGLYWSAHVCVGWQFSHFAS
ncbi:hypothetical protein Nepgr_021095 [Nepenthes gracilis]|uniref:Uncharacterized protein n=1 Tax=Nepenthes gracilis TaxID=150966 RepID=A0AAD3SY38_NEPGR|nr:hypothetical protein Nepgr_021095 [Nepenthes gracilis]